MKAAFIDTSCLVAIVFGEPGSKAMSKRLRSYDALFASPLLEAELYAAAKRERVALDDSVFDGIRWLWPNRRLSGEIEQVLAAGYVRGADLWHLACALYLFEEPPTGAFLTLDRDQGAVAKMLGFATLH